MAAVQQRILNWLYSVLTSEYQDVSRTYSDVAQTLSHYSSLTPRTEVFTYEHGASALLLHLSGTLPVTFRGTTYRFPISVWIPHAYPREAPLVYVTPTEGMMVRAGQHVDPQGKVYHPYLVGWAEFWDKSNVLDFLAILRDVFAKEPPVISRQQRNAIPSPQPTSIPPPVPPLPPDIARSSPRSPASQSGSSQAPPPPPKQYGNPGSLQGEPSRRDSGPPLPPLPPGVRSPPQSLPQPSYENQHQPVRQSSLRYETAPPRPSQAAPQNFQGASYPPQNNPPPAMQYQSYPPPPGQYPPGAPPNQAPNPSQYPPSYGGPPAQWQNQQQQPPSQQQPPPRKAPPPDLIDAPLILPDPASHVPLPAPPIPPNPEKDLLLHTLAQALRSQRTHTRTQTASSLPGLQAQHTAMLSAYHAITSETSQLEALSGLLTSNTSILHAALRDADAVIESTSSGRPPPGVDEILVAPTVVGNQLYELVSEERSIGDAIFVLSRAVERGRVSPAVFAKTTRGLAREWYLKKALARKIGRGMGLEMRSAAYGR